jgi:putative membrane protein
MLDLVLAIDHHLLIFALFGVLVAELILVRRGMDLATVAQIAKIDLWYGVLAGLIIIVGFARAIYAAKGWDYYTHNAFFWAKIGTFAAIGLLSLPPTFAYIRWRGAKVTPSDAQVSGTRLYLWLEVGALRPAPRFRRGHGARLWRVRLTGGRPGILFKLYTL